MLEEMLHAADVRLVERCLDGCEESLRNFQKTFDPILQAFMRSTGAAESEVSEIIGNLWADCIIGHGTRRPRLLNYRGRSPLVAWLKTVVLNELIDLRRRAKRLTTLDERTTRTTTSPDVEPAGTGYDRIGTVQMQFSDSPLLEIMHTALRAAVRKCPAQTQVMLQLVYLNNLTQREVARMWGWTDAKVSRALAQGLQIIEKETLQAIKRKDEWLELRWQDFVELCAYAELPIFS